jgi:hypothetical protein
MRPLTPETSYGYEASDFAENVIGLTLLPWQRWLLVHMLELNMDGGYRFRTVVVMVARQNGKSMLLQVIALWRMFVDGANLVIGTAQNLDIAEETWQGAVDMAESVPELAAEIGHVDRTNGKKALKLQAGERYKVAAASRRGGRGLSGDFVALDELREHQTWDAWAAVTKTTMARPRPQIACFSNAGDAKSVVLDFLRKQAIFTTGERSGFWDGNGDSTIGLFEWSPPDDVLCDCHVRPHTDACKLADRRNWAMANPAMGYTITDEAISSAMGTDPDDIFLTEVLCRWVDGILEPVITAGQWGAVCDPDSQFFDKYNPALGIDVAYPDKEWSAISLAGLREDGLLHVEVVDYRRGTDWVVPRVLELRDKWWPICVAVDTGGPAGILKSQFEAADVEIEEPSAREIAQGAGAFVTAVIESKSIRHIGQSELAEALSSAAKRDLGDAWAWARKGSPDISPLVSATLAHWGHQKYAHLAMGTAEAYVL